MSSLELPERLINLEMTVGHLEHELEQMHTVLIALQADLKLSRERMAKLEQRMIVANEPADERNPIDERPPHY